jgi:hypothetical protein
LNVSTAIFSEPSFCRRHTRQFFDVSNWARKAVLRSVA